MIKIELRLLIPRPSSLPPLPVPWFPQKGDPKKDLSRNVVYSYSKNETGTRVSEIPSSSLENNLSLKSPFTPSPHENMIWKWAVTSRVGAIWIKPWAVCSLEPVVRALLESGLSLGSWRSVVLVRCFWLSVHLYFQGTSLLSQDINKVFHSWKLNVEVRRSGIHWSFKALALICSEWIPEGQCLLERSSRCQCPPWLKSLFLEQRCYSWRGAAAGKVGQRGQGQV